MYYNGCSFTKNPSQALSGKKKLVDVTSLYYTTCRNSEVGYGGSIAFRTLDGSGFTIVGV